MSDAGDFASNLISTAHELGAKVLLGGRAFGRAPELWKKLGADGSAVDAPEAVALARRLVAS